MKMFPSASIPGHARCEQPIDVNLQMFMSSQRNKVQSDKSYTERKATHLINSKASTITVRLVFPREAIAFLHHSCKDELIEQEKYLLYLPRAQQILRTIYLGDSKWVQGLQSYHESEPSINKRETERVIKRIAPTETRDMVHRNRNQENSRSTEID